MPKTMPRVRITWETIDALKIPKKGDRYLWDDRETGFGIRVKPSGRKTYFIQCRDGNGSTRKKTIGIVSKDFPPKAAREKAKNLLKELSETKGGLPTVSELAERYIEEYANERKKESSVTSDKFSLNRVILPGLGQNRIDDITRGDVARLLHKHRATPYRANRAHSLLRKMFNLAKLWYDLEGDNPCTHVQRFPEKSRERILSPDELTRLGEALDRAEQFNDEAAEENTKEPRAIRAVSSSITAVRLLLLTGCRVNEVLSLKWDYVDFESGVLRLPDSKTGEKTVPIGQPAIDLLASLDRVEGNEYVLPGRKDGCHLTGIQHEWRRIRTAAEMPDLRLHDLRHHYASTGVMGGVHLSVVGSILGHRKITTTEKYTHLDISVPRRAADAISTAISEAITPKKGMRRKVSREK